MRYLLIIIMAIVLVTSQAFAFTWEGELDPNDFDKWEVLDVQPTPRGLVWMYVKNPDKESPIDVVAMAVNPKDATLLGYRYFKYGIPHSFELNPDLDKYVAKALTDKEKNSCMKCHKEQALKGRAI